MRRGALRKECVKIGASGLCRRTFSPLWRALPTANSDAFQGATILGFTGGAPSVLTGVCWGALPSANSEAFQGATILGLLGAHLWCLLGAGVPPFTGVRGISLTTLYSLLTTI